MVMRQSLGRSKAVLSLARPSPASRRGLAAPASGTFQYEVGDASGVKYASRELAGPTATLALVAKAGTRYQPLPGLAEGLEKFAFRNTHRRSALRLQREAEMLGSSYFSHHTRENVLIGAKFFRDDLPYFVEVLSEVATQTKYLDYEYKEQVAQLIRKAQHDVLKSPSALAVQSAHSLAFHRGLGEPVHPTSSTPLEKYLSNESIGAFSTLAYQKPNVAVVANGADSADLGKWVGQFFQDMRTEAASGLPAIETSQTKYYGGEERIAHAASNAMVIAFPGSSSLTGGFYKPEIAVLAAVLGGKSSIKWSPGFSLLAKAAAGRTGLKSVSTHSAIYSDAGLLYTVIEGSSSDVAATAFDTVNAIKSIADGKLAKEDFQKAVASARFSELEHGQELLAGLELTGSGLVHNGKPYQLDDSAKKIADVTIDQVQKAAVAALEYKASLSTVGDLFQLPYAEDLGLKV